MGQLACDDGDGNNLNGCNNTGFINTTYFYCGNGTIGAADYCPEICGDGVTWFANGSGRCDDGNRLPGDGCSPTCYIEHGWQCTHTGIGPFTCSIPCGQAYDMNAYPCDDGNLLNTDGCSSTCQIEFGFVCGGGDPTRPDECNEICGDGHDFHNFECEYPAGSPMLGCTILCSIEQGFFCNTGMWTDSDVCWSVCGDGYVVGTEECDDDSWPYNSNSYPANADGCANCQVGTGWYCWNSSPYTMSHCAEICGDGRTWHNFKCDDGNLVPGDGCD